MNGKRLHSETGIIFRVVPALILAGLLATGCGDAESAEDLEGEAAEETVTQDQATAPEARDSQPEPEPRAIAAGTSLHFEVAEDVSTATHQAGDTFALRLVAPVTGSGGLVLSEGTRARGLVTDARQSEGPEDEAVLAVRLESVQVDGRTRALNGTVVDADPEAGTADSRTRSAAKVATGAAAGALVGQILGGDTRSTVRGAAAGAVAGLGVALTTRDGHAVLPEGATVDVRLDDSLVVN